MMRQTHRREGRTVGLRSQGLIWVLGLSLGLGGLGLGVLTADLQRRFTAIELEDLRRDAERLRAGLNEAVAQRGRGAREWAHWSEMRDFALGGSSDFARRNLTPASIATSGLDWLVVLDLDGRPLWSVSADGGALAVADLLDRGRPRGQRLHKLPPADGHCALDRWPQQLQVICQLPIRDSEAQQPPAGILLTGEALGPAKLEQLRGMLGLAFDLLPPELPPQGDSFLPIAGAVLQAGERQHRLSWLLRVGDEAPHSLLQLSWPREMRKQTEQVLRGAQAVLIGVALLLALAVLALIELRLVRRLRHLQRRFAQLRTGEQWQARLPVEGRDELSALAVEGNHLLARIEQQVQVLAAQSRTDALTGLANRRGFEEQLQSALARCKRSGQPLSLVLIDVDHFKRFNDLHGHQAGDRALQALAQALRDAARRAGDLAARWCGEEFVLLFEGLPPQLAADRVEALRRALMALPSGPEAALAAALTVSAGMALARPDDAPESLLQRADEALYRAKANGRDRLEFEKP